MRRSLLRARPQLFHIALISTFLAVISGCAAFRGSGATPAPTSSFPPTTTPAPSATAQPTAETGIDHPTGATDVVLRAEWGGGLVPMEFFVTQAPQFTLYGDGTVVFKPLSADGGIASGKPNPPFLTGHMSENAVEELLDFALHDGGLTNAKTSYDFPGIADASTTVFTINAGGIRKTVSVYALAEGVAGPDQADRDALARLQGRLNSIAMDAHNGALDAVADYDPDAYKVVMFNQMGTGPAQGAVPIEWPWLDIKPSDFVSTDGRGATKILTRDQTAKLTGVPNGGQLSIWVTAPDKSLVEFALRPLLADELAPQADAAGYVSPDEAATSLAKCPGTGDIDAYFKIPEGDDFHSIFPNAGLAPELDGVDGAFVVVYSGRILLPAYGGAPGSSHDPYGTDVVCVVLPTGEPNVYLNVSRDGMALPPGSHLGSP